MERTITGFHVDDVNEWVAELSCGHQQHVRHRPPFQIRDWVPKPDGRSEKLGSPIDCRLCDRGEPPIGLRLVRSSPEWNEQTVPAGLLHTHQTTGDIWGRVVVHEGQLRFSASTEPVIDVVLGPESRQAIPPDIEHHVQPIGPVRFSIKFLAVSRPAVDVWSSPDTKQSEGGDPACWSGLICLECGAVIVGGHHRQGCSPIVPWQYARNEIEKHEGLPSRPRGVQLCGDRDGIVSRSIQRIQSRTDRGSPGA